MFSVKSVPIHEVSVSAPGWDPMLFDRDELQIAIAFTIGFGGFALTAIALGDALLVERLDILNDRVQARQEGKGFFRLVQHVRGKRQAVMSSDELFTSASFTNASNWSL